MRKIILRSINTINCRCIIKCRTWASQKFQARRLMNSDLSDRDVLVTLGALMGPILGLRFSEHASFSPFEPTGELLFSVICYHDGWN